MEGQYNLLNFIVLYRFLNVRFIDAKIRLFFILTKYLMNIFILTIFFFDNLLVYRG